MSNIRKAFEGGKAFIPFITCGDPSLEITEQLVYAMEEAGADLIELGIPFSDPTSRKPTSVLSPAASPPIRSSIWSARSAGNPAFRWSS